MLNVSFHLYDIAKTYYSFCVIYLAEVSLKSRGQLSWTLSWKNEKIVRLRDEMSFLIKPDMFPKQ